MTRAYVLDVLERAIFTFLQAAIGALAVAFAGSGLDAEHLTDWSIWQKVLVSAAVAGVAAVASLIKSLLAGAKTGTASLSTTVANSTPFMASTPETTPHIPEHQE